MITDGFFRFDQALEALLKVGQVCTTQEKGAGSAGRAFLSAVVVSLANGDLVGANLVYQQGMG